MPSQNGRLVRPFDFGLKLARTYWIVCRKATSAKPEIATFRDWPRRGHKAHTRLRVQRASGVPHALYGREIYQRLGRIARRGRERVFGIRKPSFPDVQVHIVDAPLGAGPESILPVVVMDSGLARSLSSGRALRGPVGAPRNDGAAV